MNPLNPPYVNKENCPANNNASWSQSIVQKNNAINAGSSESQGGGNGNLSATATVPPLALNFSVCNAWQLGRNITLVELSSIERQQLNGSMAHMGINTATSIPR